MTESEFQHVEEGRRERCWVETQGVRGSVRGGGDGGECYIF